MPRTSTIPVRRRSIWIAGLACLCAGALFYYLVAQFDDPFADRWAQVAPGMSADEVAAVLGEPTTIGGDVDLDWRDFLFAGFDVGDSFWVYHRPARMGRSACRYIVYFKFGTVTAVGTSAADE